MSEVMEAEAAEKRRVLRDAILPACIASATALALSHELIRSCPIVPHAEVTNAAMRLADAIALKAVPEPDDDSEDSQ